MQLLPHVRGLRMADGFGQLAVVLCRALLEDEELAGVPLSVDTYYAEVARDAVGAGAHIVNDISGGSLDRDMHAQVRGKFSCIRVEVPEALRFCLAWNCWFTASSFDLAGAVVGSSHALCQKDRG